MPGLSPAPSDLGGKCEKARSDSCFYLQTKQGKQLWTPCQGVRPRSGPGAGGGGQGLSANLEAPEACIGLCLLWAPPGKAKRVALVRSDEGEAGPWGTGLPASLPLSGAQQESGGARFCLQLCWLSSQMPAVWAQCWGQMALFWCSKQRGGTWC